MQLVLQRLEGALSEIKELRAENRAIKLGATPNKTRINYENKDVIGLPKLDNEHAVLAKPMNTGRNSTDLYTNQHEVAKRGLDNSIRELFFYLFEQTRKHSKNPDFKAFGDHVINQVGFFKTNEYFLYEMI